MSSNDVVKEEVSNVISVRGVGKSYRMYERPSHRLWQALVGKRKSLYTDFWALQDVTFEVAKGETIGIIGRNGSGKSTLLQMIAGILTPTTGEIVVHGKVAALLELGSGFNPQFTGRENVYLNASILGLTRTQIDARMKEILEFADIGDFIDQPVRSYSSGMSVRLAFAVIAHVDADILVIDEALAVGDAFFSQKCMRFLRDFQRRGTLLFVSHDAAAVTNLCKRAVWLDRGCMRLVGTSQEVIEAYMTEQHVADRRAAGERIVVKAKRSSTSNQDIRDFRLDAMREAGVHNRTILFDFDPSNVGSEFGAKKAKITDVALLDEQKVHQRILEGGELVCLRISVELLEDLQDLIVGFYVKDRLGQRLFGDNTFFSCRANPLHGKAGQRLVVVFTFRMPTMPSGSYMVDAAVASGNQHEHTQQHWIFDALEFRATDETMRHGLVGIPMLSIDASFETA